MFILNMWTACLENGFFYNHNDLRIDDEDHYEAHTNLARYYQDNGNYGEGIRELKTAYKLHPDSLTKANLENAKSRTTAVKPQKALQYQ
jgi:tetratricopeptide (TPR) repeat protein